MPEGCDTAMLPPGPRAEDDAEEAKPDGANLLQQLLVLGDQLLTETKALRSEVGAFSGRLTAIELHLGNVDGRLQEGELRFQQNEEASALALNALGAICQSNGLLKTAEKIDAAVERWTQARRSNGAVHEIKTSPNNSRPPPPIPDAE